MKKHLVFILAGLLLLSFPMLAQNTNTTKAFELKNTRDIGIPEISFSTIEADYNTYDTVEATAKLYSNELIDQICGIGYELYKDGLLVENIGDYGSLTYAVRQEADIYFHDTLTQGSGMIQVIAGEDTIGAFTLGIFDNYCVNRNRPINFTTNLNVTGVYKMVSTIYTCSNTGTATGTSFIASDCDGAEHFDSIAQTCEDPIAIRQDSVSIVIISAIEINQQPLSQIICDYNVANLTVDAETTTDGTITYQWYHNGTIIEEETENTLETALAGNYYCILMIGEEELMTEVATITIAEVTPLLEPVISVCNGSTIELNPGEFASYEWQDASINQTYEVSEDGIFAVTVTDENGCTASAQTEIILSEDILNIYWNDTVNLCEGSNIMLTAPKADEYEWGGGETEQTLTVVEGGWYYLTITQSTCSGNDSVYVKTIDSPQEFSLGADIFACQNAVSINGPNFDNISFLWSTNETTQNIEVSEAGTYTLSIINELGCARLDTIEVEFGTELQVNLHTADTLETCVGTKIILDPEVGNQWHWSNNSTLPSIVANTQKWYYVTVNNEYGCEGNDSVFVKFNTLPYFNLGENQIHCADESITISAQNDVSWLWSTEETTQEITITSTGTYSCTVTNENNCQYSDTIKIHVFQLPNVDLGIDAIIQANQTLILGVPEGEYMYEWNNGATTSHILIDATQLSLGTHEYSVTVTNINYNPFNTNVPNTHEFFCENSDQITVTIVPESSVPENIANKISIMPNPTNGIINIVGQNISNITIFDNIGKELISTKNPNIDLSKYPAGMYFAKIVAGNYTITKKLIKQ